MSPEDQLKVLDDERAELLTKADQNPDEWTDEDVARAETVIKSIKELRDSIAKRDAATAALRSAGMGRTSEKSHNEDGDVILKGGLGDRFVNSEAYKAFRAAHALPVDGMPVSIAVSNISRSIRSSAARSRASCCPLALFSYRSRAACCLAASSLSAVVASRMPR